MIFFNKNTPRFSNYGWERSKPKCVSSRKSKKIILMCFVKYIYFALNLWINCKWCSSFPLRCISCWKNVIKSLIRFSSRPAGTGRFWLLNREFSAIKLNSSPSSMNMNHTLYFFIMTLNYWTTTWSLLTLLIDSAILSMMKMKNKI